jgi:hypothetical protein
MVANRGGGGSGGGRGGRGGRGSRGSSKLSLIFNDVDLVKIKNSLPDAIRTK